MSLSGDIVNKSPIGDTAARLSLTMTAVILLPIGLHVVGKVSKLQAAIAATITWVVGALPALLGAVRGG